MLTFETLIQPLAPAAFVDDFWEQRIQSGHWDLDESFAPGVTRDGIEDLLSSLTSVDADWVQIRKAGGTALSPQQYLTRDGFLNVEKVLSLFDSGYSISLSKLHKRSPAIADLCRSAEKTLSELGIILADRVGSHLYLTPSQSQAVLPHYDNLNVFALQVEGAKLWRVYGPDESLPLEPQPHLLASSELPPLLRECRLEPGQFLYIPRGFYHEAIAQELHSLHITLDVYTRTWADLVSDAARALPDLRRSIRIGTASSLRKEFTSALKALKSTNPSERAEQFNAALFERLDLLPEDGFNQINSAEVLELLSRVTRRRGSFARVVGDGDCVKFLFPGGGVSGPMAIEPVFRFLSETPAFTVQDLPLVSDESKLSIVKDLILGGFLRRDEGGTN